MRISDWSSDVCSSDLTIEAEPAAIFEILRDPMGHVSIDASGMLLDATGEPASAAGDTVVIHMDREALTDYPLGKYDVTVKITTFEQDGEIAWTIEGQIKPQIGHVYGYQLAQAEGGQRVTPDTTSNRKNSSNPC